jgi:hypothetical protein
MAAWIGKYKSKAAMIADLGNIIIGQLARTTRQITTSNLAPGASVSGTVSLGRSFHFIKLVASSACWFRLYSSNAAMLADSGRLITDDPAPGSGVLCDLYPSGSALTIPLSPPIWGASLESSPSPSITYLITNMGASSVALTLTLTYLALEQ